MKKIKVAVILCMVIIMFETHFSVNAATVGLIGVTDTGHDHTGYFEDINEDLNEMGYSDIQISTYIDPEKSTVLDVLDSCEIVVTRSHGDRYLNDNGDAIGNYIVLPSECLYNSDIEDMKEDLSNAKLVVYGGCYTAAGGVSLGTERNLVVATENRGAATAVGFTKSINCTGANTWVGYLFKNLASGKNIDISVNDAVKSTKNKHFILDLQGVLNIDSCLYRGVWDYTW